jgi:TIR domain
VPIPAELFFSHSSHDREFAEQLRQVLDRHHVPYWYSPRHLVGAQQWHDEIGKALDRCDWFAVILSPAAVGSTWVKRELLAALEDTRYDGKIVPILYQPCDLKKLSWTLSGFQRVDFTRQSFEEGCRELLRIWNLGDVSAPT